MRAFLKFLGCRLNEAELQLWSQQLIEGGFQLSSMEDAELMILNSCAVTGEAARKSRQAIRRLHRENPTAHLVVTGCYASLDSKEVESILGVDLVVSNDSKEQLVELIKEGFQYEEKILPTMPAFATEPAASALFMRNRDRAFIKIQDGCRYRCSYCIVTVARGEERSRSIDAIINEINTYVRQGIQEVVLTGVHVGGYGTDLKASLMQLVQAILSDTTIKRLRFASVEPWDLPENFFKLFANPRLMPHMHLPLQSGSDTILRKMLRRCDQKNFSDLVTKARQSVPDFNITTDIIVGFPGESEKHWQESLSFIQETGFGHIHIFNYSHREGTKAAKFTDQISSTIKKARCQELSIIARNMKQDAMNTMQGKQIDVLWESGMKQLAENQYQFSGYTPNYHRVVVKTELDISGLILPVKINGYSDDNKVLAGKLILPEDEINHPLISVKQI
ncbi:MAG: tRNA (N(6)-L-threonylcarbamoyladenosine(37)-C(2))-methylthiotransferase MtaB [Gammaproteobacteria bacterium]|nr:tRNA (N(6)-L-threonylcarbamoyladenosine(37)-C(2))-methylthiotransferase MtaB [Gammaproteobacteria bacterium]